MYGQRNVKDRLVLGKRDFSETVLLLAAHSAPGSLCLHKHAWKRIDSITGAKSSAIVYSITETVKANNQNPFHYLEYVLTVI